MADKTMVADRDPFANERMGRDLTTFSDNRILLDLDKRPDLGLITDRAAVKIDKFGHFYILAQLDVIGDA